VFGGRLLNTLVSRWSALSSPPVIVCIRRRYGAAAAPIELLAAIASSYVEDQFATLLAAVCLLDLVILVPAVLRGAPIPRQ